jgi:integrase
VSLPGFLCDALAEHIARYPAASGFVFTSAEGGLIRWTNFRRRVWQPAVAASVGEPCRFHDLRHSHAALLIAQGEHPKVIQGRLGHASIGTTLDTYGHLFEGLDEAAADRLEDAYRRSDVVRMWSPGPAEVIPLPHR